MNQEPNIERELLYFDSDAQRRAFQVARVEPRTYPQGWEYSAQIHQCAVVAADDRTQIVYCATGFGPAFPWSVQKVGEQNLGMDSEWLAYLYEAFVCSTMWHEGVPEGFMHMGPDERERPNTSLELTREG